MNEQMQITVISYIPLLTGRAGEILSPEDFNEDRFKDCHPGNVEACLWAQISEEEGVVPVFVLDRAHEVADHLVEWAENDLDRWFALCFQERGDLYTALLMPNIDESIRRFKQAQMIINRSKPPEDAKYTAIFHPLKFTSQSENTFKKVRDRIRDRSNVGFLDITDIDKDNPLDINEEDIKSIGPFNVCWDSTVFGLNIENLCFEDEEEAT